MDYSEESKKIHKKLLSLRSLISIGMVVKLIIVWFLAVVAFFALWAILAKVVKRISEKKNKTE